MPSARRARSCGNDQILIIENDGLGDLEFEAVSRQVGLGQHPLDAGDEIAPAQLGGKEIDADADYRDRGSDGRRIASRQACASTQLPTSAAIGRIFEFRDEKAPGASNPRSGCCAIPLPPPPPPPPPPQRKSASAPVSAPVSRSTWGCRNTVKLFLFVGDMKSSAQFLNGLEFSHADPAYRKACSPVQGSLLQKGRDRHCREACSGSSPEKHNDPPTQAPSLRTLPANLEGLGQRVDDPGCKCLRRDCCRVSRMITPNSSPPRRIDTTQCESDRLHTLRRQAQEGIAGEMAIAIIHEL